MYIPTIKRKAFPKRGPTNSNELNDFNDQTASDIIAVTNLVNTQEIEIQNTKKTILDEVRFLTRKVLQLEQEKAHDKQIQAKNGLRINFHQSMYKVDNLDFLGSNTALRPVITPQYGIAHLPINGIENKFFSTSIYNGNVITPSSLSVSVSPSFTPAGAVQAVDYSDGSLFLKEGNLKNAFNGNNVSYWVYEAAFPAQSDVTEFALELIVTIPSQNNTESNCLTIHPYPLGSVDILSIATSPDLTQSWTILQHSDAPTEDDPLNNATAKKFVFAPLDVDQVRVRLRTRNFTEEDGKKIFRLGLQELGLFLIDFEKSSAAVTFSNWTAQGDDTNISMVHRIDAPEGMAFTAIHDFRSSPDIALESDSNRHIIFRIYNGNPIGSVSQELWNSNQTFPQDQPDSVGAQITLAGTVTSLYVVTNMRYVETSGGTTSPYAANTSPYINSFSIEVSAVPIN